MTRRKTMGLIGGASALLLLANCGSTEGLGDAADSDGTLGSGGSFATGGAAASGGSVATGGAATGGESATGGYPAKTPGTAQVGDVTVDPETVHQTMDGYFGVADVWQGKSSSTPTRLKLLFDPVEGIGLSLLRIGIDTDGKIMGDAAFVDGPEVVKYGGKVWAAPWSPPASAKDNNDVNNGGHLKTSEYTSWANTLAAFPAYYKEQSGVDLWGISPQNEPDFVASYKSCIYNATQMNDFIKVLGPKLQALSPQVNVVAAEPDVWSHMWNNGDKYGSAIIADSTVSSLVNVIATHDYGSDVNSTTRAAPPAGVQQHIWETEATYTAGAGIGPGLDIARGIYAAVVGGGVNGWHYWWYPSFFDGGSDVNPPKRVYAMGNFSKFVRPGYVRIDISGVPSSVQIVPFFNAEDGTTTIVALNSSGSDQQVSFFVAGAAWPANVTPHVTSSSANLLAGTPIPLSAGRFSATLSAQSVTTFVGTP